MILPSSASRLAPSAAQVAAAVVATRIQPCRAETRSTSIPPASTGATASAVNTAPAARLSAWVVFSTRVAQEPNQATGWCFCGSANTWSATIPMTIPRPRCLSVMPLRSGSR